MAALTIADLNNAKLDVDHIAAVATSTGSSATDRLGNVKDTVAGAVASLKAFNSRGAWVALAAYSLRDIVSNGGTWYACVSAHTSSATFAADSDSKWRIHQGLSSADLASSGGAALVGNGQMLVSEFFDDLSSVMKVIPRSQHAAIRAGTSTYDASDVIQAALAAGRRLVVPAGVVINAKNLNSVEGGALVCLTGRATIKVPSGAGYCGIRLNSNNFTLDGINFDGGNVGPYNVSGAKPGTRAGVIIGNEFGTGAQLNGITYRNSDVFGFDNTGVSGREVQNGMEFGKRCVLDNVTARHNFSNWWHNPRFEYITATNCYGYAGFSGIVIQSGNVSLAGWHCENNFYNVQLSAGENDGHGQMTGCSMNHAAPGGYGLFAVGITNGFIVNGCALWYAPIRLENCTGIAIRNCQIAHSSVEVVGGGENYIDDNYTPFGLEKTFTGVVHTSFRRNRTYAGDTAREHHYGDMAVRADAATYAYPIAWNSVSGAPVPLSLSLKKWHGQDANFLDAGTLGTGFAGRVYIPRTGYYNMDVRIMFNTLAVDEVVSVILVRYGADGARVEAIVDSRSFKANCAGCTVAISTRLLCVAGETISIELKTSTATGITVAAGGIRVQINSID